MNFAERLRQLRAQKKLSQGQLGKLVGLHYTQIGRYEREESVPSSDALIKLAEILEVSIDYLMEGSLESVAKTNFSDKELFYQFKQIEELEEQDKKTIKIFLDAFLSRNRPARSS